MKRAAAVVAALLLVVLVVLWPRRARAVGPMLTEDVLRAAMPAVPKRRVAELPQLVAAMEEFGITDPANAALFLGQLATESGDLQWWEEFASGEAYEGRADLGNTQPGDGRRYKGRGPIQLTGRRNYQLASRALGVDLEGNPELAATAPTGYRVAAWFWKANGLTSVRDVVQATRKVNGGTNALADRKRRTAAAMAALGVDPGDVTGLA